ncbi:hypothetical protein ABIF14_009507 [Bradyrhizobium elkanii]
MCRPGTRVIPLGGRTTCITSRPRSPVGAVRCGSRRRRARNSGRATPSLRHEPGVALSSWSTLHFHPVRRAATYTLTCRGMPTAQASPRSVSPCRNGALSPYPASASTHPKRTLAAIARSISANAISGLDRGVRCSTGTRARFKRDALLVQLSGRKRRNATITGTSPRASVKDTSVWQFAVLPRADAY